MGVDLCLYNTFNTHTLTHTCLEYVLHSRDIREVTLIQYPQLQLQCVLVRISIKLFCTNYIKSAQIFKDLSPLSLLSLTKERVLGSWLQKQLVVELTGYLLCKSRLSYADVAFHDEQLSSVRAESLS